ncbi:potassium-transporting ATPase subunit KdpA [Microcella daejeonensis]|uniref:Potassium-transporting ATPase potassium-binding subunit n=1 Tax=Microcella daejeonensis TaxID=2994971 RepID=A0A9E8MMZ3_9MICO|nr:potassium-transporting ATPase subunit KdpA [Microcella daejeonensis]WAB82379.1 potassium-transporting ATPase subunit KdpA [Microcella daejeonensis]
MTLEIGLLAAQLGTIALLVAIIHRPLGDYMARVYTSPRDRRIERPLLRLMGVDSAAMQDARGYTRALLLFSAAGAVVLYALQRTQQLLPASLGLPAVSPDLAFNTAVSFVTNTNWQSYSPELTLGYTVQAVGLVVQNFVSAAVGMAVAVALFRGLAARGTGFAGNFWVDLVRGVVRILLPMALLAAIVLLAGGVVQNLSGFVTVETLTGGTATVPGGPVASQEAIKLIGTNGGGFFNANAAHPFENPTGWTSLVEILLILAIPFSFPRTFGTMVGDVRQGRAVAGAMAILATLSVVALAAAELAGGGTAPQLAGGAMEGKEQRFGIGGSVLYAGATTLTSTGSVNSMHDSFTALGGGVTMLNMMLGEVAPGGVGSGMYGMLVIAIVAVFIAGLMVGRTPEYLGKKIGPPEMTLASLYILITPVLVLAGTALSATLPGVRDDVETTSIYNPGVHGYSELLYAFTSAANNNGSAFAGLTANTPWLNTALGVAMVLGRFIPIVIVIALARSLAAREPVPSSAGSLPTHGMLFTGLLVGVTVIVSALTYFPALALGPLAEGL